MVNIKNYTPFSYSEYLNGNKVINRPPNANFNIGEVVVIKENGKELLGVILGCVDEERGELRTDMSGMVSIENVRHAVLSDLKSLPVIDKLRAECEGYKVSYNWKTYETKISKNKIKK
jgi:hypothetical protein